MPRQRAHCRRCTDKHRHPLLIEPCTAPLPTPPQLPNNFYWRGRYRVPDLHIDVPLLWFARDGDVQMIVGCDSSPVHFTNIIFRGNFYTYTFRWPGLQAPFLPPLEVCQPVPFTLETLNAYLAANSRFVGVERIGCPLRSVNHFRVGLVLPRCPSGAYFRLPIALADIYVDRHDSTVFRQVLQFGLQNLYDPELDEWATIERVSSREPPEVTLPPACETQCCTQSTAPAAQDICIPLPAPRRLGGLAIHAVLEAVLHAL